MLRSIYAYVMILSSIVCGGILLLLFTSIKANRLAHTVAVVWARWCIHVCGITLDTDLRELDPSQCYIFVANHQSQVDIPILMALLAPFKISFVAKHTLFAIPILGRAMRALGCVPIDRSNPRKALKALTQAIQQEDTPRSFVVFPEGTRNQQLGPFKPGAIIMALKTGLPLVPLVINGSAQILPKASWRITPGRVTVQGLDPIQLEATSALKQRKELTQKLWNLMNDKLLESFHV